MDHVARQAHGLGEGFHVVVVRRHAVVAGVAQAGAAHVLVGRAAQAVDFLRPAGHAGHRAAGQPGDLGGVRRHHGIARRDHRHGEVRRVKLVEPRFHLAGGQVAVGQFVDRAQEHVVAEGFRLRLAVLLPLDLDLQRAGGRGAQPGDLGGQARVVQLGEREAGGNLRHRLRVGPGDVILEFVADGKVGDRPLARVLEGDLGEVVPAVLHLGVAVDLVGEGHERAAELGRVPGEFRGRHPDVRGGGSQEQQAGQRGGGSEDNQQFSHG